MIRSNIDSQLELPYRNQSQYDYYEKDSKSEESVVFAEMELIEESPHTEQKNNQQLVSCNNGAVDLKSFILIAG